MGEYLANKRIVVTGGSGFLGRRVIKRLEKSGCAELVPLIAELF